MIASKQVGTHWCLMFYLVAFILADETLPKTDSLKCIAKYFESLQVDPTRRAVILPWVLQVLVEHFSF